MLIYNFQKKFLGIDEKDLHTLGYKTLAQLQTQVSDFADLFVKTPGYIHNFQHIHWIDFVIYAESDEESQVIINANAKTYKALVSITTMYLADNPAQQAYCIHLNNLQELTTQEYDNISEDITLKEVENIIVEDEDRENTVDKQQKSTYHFDPYIASKELGLPLDLIQEFIQDFIKQANDFKGKLYEALEEEDINNVKMLSHKLKGVAANLRIEDAHEILCVINATSDADVIKTNLDAFYNIIDTLSKEDG